MLFGNYNPTGRLSVTRPVSMQAVPVNRGDDNYQSKAIFEYGFGLSD